MRQTVGSLIDKLTERLGDNASVVTRSEILDWLTDGYARLIREASTPCLLEAHDIPPRTSYAVTHEWERQYVRGTTRKFTYTHESGRYECTYLHEVSLHAGQTALDAVGNVTQLHSLELITHATDSSYRFALPRRQDLLCLWYDHRLLLPVPGRSLEGAGAWWEIEGLPGFYSTDDTYNEFDLYRIETTNQGAYQTDRPIGIPRQITGDRTYEISPRGEAGIGIIREISSPDRQYHNSVSWQAYGTIRSWASSEDNLMVYSAVEPERKLSEENALDLIPSQLEKYCVYYVLAMVHNRQGELYEPNLAEHYRLRFRRGTVLLSKIRNVGYRDTEYGRDRGMRPRHALATPQLPDNYPRLRMRR